MPHRHKRGPQRLVHGAAMHHHERARRRQRNQVEFIFHAEEERALGAGEESAEVKRSRTAAVEDLIKAGGVHKGIERIARVAACHLRPRIGVADEPAIGGTAEQVVDLAIDPRLEGVGTRALLGELVV